jgi:hypothetical protein
MYKSNGLWLISLKLKLKNNIPAVKSHKRICKIALK